MICTLRCEIVKPLGVTWDELGATLRALRAPLHRVLNRTITDLEIGERAGRHGKDGIHPRTASYQLTRDLWAEERAGAAARVESGKAYPGDDVIAATAPSSATILGAAGDAYTRWSKWRKEKWRGEMSLPTYKKEAAVSIASSSKAVQIEARDGLAVLDLRLVVGARARLVIRPYGGSGFADLARLLEEPERLGSCRIVQTKADRGGKRKWQAMLSWDAPVREREPGATMAVHRGIRNFLTVAISDPEREPWAKSLDDGHAIVAHQKAYQARRRELGRHGKSLGDGSRGHGRARRFERITRIEDAEARWTRTVCQQRAAAVVRLAEQRRVSRILIEDWTTPVGGESSEWMERTVRTFPFAQLRASIEWAAKKRGFEVEVVPGAYESRTCPKCAHVHEAPPIDRRGVFLCATCMFERPVDLIAAMNLLIRAGEPNPSDGLIKATKRAARRMKGK